MITKLTNVICDIKYELYGVKLNAQNFLISREYPNKNVCVTYHVHR